jgi:hypothetical protein
MYHPARHIKAELGSEVPKLIWFPGIHIVMLGTVRFLRIVSCFCAVKFEGGCFLQILKLPYYTDKKENKIFLIYKEIQMGSGAKLYIRKGFLIYEEMRNFFPIYEETASHI